VLRYTNKTLGTGDFENVENSITVVSQDKTIMISSTTENLSGIFIYDISGKQLYSQNVSNVELSISNLPFAQQVLLVKTVLENNSETINKLVFKDLRPIPISVLNSYVLI
jgi:myo-inositol-hexaphosphate 3-phosphohydrolase